MDTDGKVQDLQDQLDTFVAAQKKKDEDMSKRMGEYETKFSTHHHTGKDSVHVQQKDVTPSIRAAGSITMATNGRTYKLGIIENPTQVTFTGAAVHSTDGTFSSASIDIRSTITGIAILGHSFQFQPVDTSTVTAGGTPADYIQNSNALTVKVSATAAMVTTVSENHLVSVNYPTNATQVARATVTAFAEDHVEVYAELASNWEIVGNFTVT